MLTGVLDSISVWEYDASMETTNRYRATGLGQFIEEQGRLLEWVAEQGGVHPSLITHLLAGRRTVREDVARKIAAALGVPFGFAFELTHGSKSNPQVALSVAS
jgi:transcriptional regulator with XRE-family HTH domain